MKDHEGADEGPGDDDSRGEDEAKAYSNKAKATIGRSLANAAEVDEGKKAKYRAAAEAVIDAMGLEALKRWNNNVESITFYPDTESINQFVRSLRPGLTSAIGVRGLCARNPFEPRLCSLHLNGGSDTGDEFSRSTRDGYAHEFAHAIDWGTRESGLLSRSALWADASRAEKKMLRDWLNVQDRGPADDFANFGIAAWNYPEAARRHYPECWGFWSDRGLTF